MSKRNSIHKNGSDSPTTQSKPARSRKTASVKSLGSDILTETRDLRQNWNHSPIGSITFPTQSNSTKKSPWRPSTQLDRSEIQYLLSNPNYHYRTHKSPQPASILSQMNTIQNLLNQISLRQIYIYFLKLSSHPSIRFRVFLLQVFSKRTVGTYAWILW